jgi:hypothetical protein
LSTSISFLLLLGEKKVVIALRIVCIPEAQPPYNYWLFRPNETSDNSTVRFGVLWHGNNTSEIYDLREVMVVGILRLVSAGYFTTGGYFIEAESVIPL